MTKRRPAVSSGITATHPKVRAYSYVRFSTPEQAGGDSLPRQKRMADEWIAVHPEIELDTSLRIDSGVSAYRGRNLQEGSLGEFVERVRQGDVRAGSYLLLETLDRFSRKEPIEAAGKLREICKLGIVVVTLRNGKEYTEESTRRDPGSILQLIMEFIVGSEESDKKSGRLKSAWARKRANASEEVMTGACPGWLKLDRDTGEFVVIPARAEIVQRMFHETLQGCSPHSLALAFQVEEVPMFGRGKLWHRSYVMKCLENTATIGTMTPHTSDYVSGKMQRKAMAPVENYFPAIIDARIFERVRQLRRSKPSPMRGKHAGKEVTNIFGSIGKCARCGATMTRVNKGKSGGTHWHYLVCTAAKNGAGCLYELVRYGQVESAFLAHVEYLVANAPAGDNGRQIDRDIAQLEASLEGTEAAYEKLKSALTRAPSAAIAARIRDVEIERDALIEQRETLYERRAETSGKLVRSKLAELRKAATAKPLNRTSLNAIMRQTVESVTVDSENGLLLFHWKHGGESEIVYAAPAVWIVKNSKKHSHTRSAA